MALLGRRRASVRRQAGDDSDPESAGRGLPDPALELRCRRRRHRPHPTVLVTSAYANEGKTSITANLAVSLAAAGKRVGLVDFDLRHPDLHNWFGADNESACPTFSSERRRLEDCLQYLEVDTGCTQRARALCLLTDRPAVEQTTELLSSGQDIELLEALGQAGRIVLIDTPPVLPVADTLVIGRIVSGLARRRGGQDAGRRGAAGQGRPDPQPDAAARRHHERTIARAGVADDYALRLRVRLGNSSNGQPGLHSARALHVLGEDAVKGIARGRAGASSIRCSPARRILSSASSSRRRSAPTQFGAFSLVYAGYGFCLGLSEGITSTPLIVRFSAAAGSELRAAELDSVGRLGRRGRRRDRLSGRGFVPRPTVGNSLRAHGQ